MKSWLTLALAIVITTVTLHSHNCVSAPRNLDAEVILQLAEAGSDLKKPHNISFVFYFMEIESANKIAKQLKSAGYSTNVSKAPPYSWFMFILQADKTIFPIESDLSTMREKFNKLVNPEGGVYDGWGADVVE